MAKRGTNLLSDMQIRRWIAADKPLARSDGDGLTFTLSAAGTASWVLRYRFSGRAREMTVGNYPDISLGAARARCRELRADIDRGIDPGLVKQQEKSRAAQDSTVRQLAPYFLDAVKSERAAKTLAYRQADIDQVVVPKLGSRMVRDINAADVVDMLLKSKRTWSMTKRLLTTTSQFLDHACGRQIISANPCAGIKLKALMGARPPIRRRVMLTEPELRTLLSNIEEIGTENALALRILLATCVRSVELAKARWEHIDFDRGTWVVPAASVKTRRGFLVPLTPTTLGWFQVLRDIAAGSAWVLPARQERRMRANGGDMHVGETTLWAAINRAFLRNALDVRRFTPHDTRSTAKGHMRNLGVTREVSELALNHVLQGMEGIYDVREDIPERRAALELWAAFLESCAAGKAWNVTPLRAAS
jgi:integrase